MTVVPGINVLAGEPDRFRGDRLFDHDFLAITGHMFMSQNAAPVTLEVDTKETRKLRCLAFPFDHAYVQYQS